MKRPHCHRKTHSLSWWGVLLAFVLQTLAWSMMPVSVAAAGTDDGWVVICTSDGFKRISLADAGMQPQGPEYDGPVSVLAGHCDLCVFASGLGMVPELARLLKSGHGVLVLSLPTADAAIPAAPHTLHQPRAPPVHKLI